MRFVVEVYCAGKQNKQWRETAVPTICLFCKLLWVKVLCTHVDCENCSVSDIYTQTAIDLFSAYSCDDHTHTCTSKHVHTLSLDSPVYTISHEDKHACTNRASLRIALYRSSEAQTAIRLNPIYTRQSQGCACKHACTHTHTHTHTASMRIALSPVHTHKWQSVWILHTPVGHEDGGVRARTHKHNFCKNCTVSGSYTQTTISLDSVNTRQSWGCTYKHLHPTTHTHTPGASIRTALCQVHTQKL